MRSRAQVKRNNATLRAFICGYCGARPGETCRTASGGEAGMHHDSRLMQRQRSILRPMSGHRPWAEIREAAMPPEGTPERAAAEARIEKIKGDVLRETGLKRHRYLTEELISLVLLHDNCADDEERELLHCTPPEIIAWIRRVYVPEFLGSSGRSS